MHVSGHGIFQQTTLSLINACCDYGILYISKIDRNIYTSKIVTKYRFGHTKPVFCSLLIIHHIRNAAFGQ